MSAPAPGDRVLVGRVRRAHGLRGEVLVEPLSDASGRFAPGSRLLLVHGGGECEPTRVTSCRRHGEGLLLGLERVGGRSEAERLRGATLEVERSRSPTPPSGSFYYHALERCVCRDRRHGPLGSVTAVLEDGGGLLLEVAYGDRKLLIPFVTAYLVSVDPEAGEIELDLPEGLLEACVSTS